MGWLKKSLITMASVLAFQTVSSQEYRYDIQYKWGFVGGSLGEVVYVPKEKDLTITLDHFLNVKFHYFMTNDSTYIESSKVDDLHEKYIYVKQAGSWKLEDYTALKGQERKDKVLLRDSVYLSNVLTSIETLESFLQNDLLEQNDIMVFGNSYKITIEDKKINSEEVYYKGDISPYTKTKNDKFLIEDGVKIVGKRYGENMIPQKLYTKAKILFFIKPTIELKLQEPRKSEVYQASSKQ